MCDADRVLVGGHVLKFSCICRCKNQVFLVHWFQFHRLVFFQVYLQNASTPCSFSSSISLRRKTRASYFSEFPIRPILDRKKVHVQYILLQQISCKIQRWKSEYIHFFCFHFAFTFSYHVIFLIYIALFYSLIRPK